MKKCYTVYKTTNLINKMYYIGSHETFDPNDAYLGSGTRLLAAVKEYGRENFKKEVLRICETQEEMFAYEKELVTEEVARSNESYNVAVGGRLGHVGWHANNLFFDNEFQRKISPWRRLWADQNWRAVSCKRVSEQTRQRHAQGMYKYSHLNWTGRKHSEQTKEKMRSSAVGKQVGEKNSQFGTCWVFNEQTHENKKVKLAELDKFLLQGWVKGRQMT